MDNLGSIIHVDDNRAIAIAADGGWLRYPKKLGLSGSTGGNKTNLEMSGLTDSTYICFVSSSC